MTSVHDAIQQQWQVIIGNALWQHSLIQNQVTQLRNPQIDPQAFTSSWNLLLGTLLLGEALPMG